MLNSPFSFRRADAPAEEVVRSLCAWLSACRRQVEKRPQKSTVTFIVPLYNPPGVSEVRTMDPPSENVVPGFPELVKVTVLGLSTVNSNVLVGSAWFTSVTLGALIRTTSLLEPVTVYCATLVLPEQVTLTLAHVNTPFREMPILAPLQLPGVGAIAPRSRSCTHSKASGLLTLAVMTAI